jgi:hypothetical protein
VTAAVAARMARRERYCMLEMETVGEAGSSACLGLSRGL